MKEYIPLPVDDTGIELPEELTGLSEMLAKNVHEVWARNRMSQGWTYGPQRSETAKTHPCLVPYEQLSEEEKDYDRHTSISTLKYILKAGFYIQKKNS